MRRIVAFNRVTADGYFAAPDGGLGWFVPDDELDAAGASRMGDVDTMLFGRRTYDLFESFWPQAVDDSPTAPDPHTDGRRTRTIRDMAVWINETPKLVVSRTRTEVPWRNSRLLPSLDGDAVRALKAEPGGSIIIFGSGTVVSQLTRDGLIDEYQFVVSPTLLGAGRPLVADVPASTRLALAECTAYPSGNVMLRYVRG